MPGNQIDVPEFERILKLGLGRAVLLLQGNSAEPLRDLILRACLHNLAYDPQCEGDRAEYMLDVIQATNDVAFYRQRILDALRDSSDDWDATQLFDFARLFAQQGDKYARLVLYEKVEANIAEENYFGTDEIVKLDGLPGFRFVAELLGELALTNPDFDDDDDLLRLVEEQYGEDVARQELGKLSAGSPRVAAYLATVHASRARREAKAQERANTPPISYDQLKQLIADKGAAAPRGLLFRWGGRATAEDLQRAARDLLMETDRDRLLAYLRLFRRTCFPLDHTKLLALSGSTDEDIALEAFAALRQISHPTVRELALHLIESSQRTAEAVELLRNNYEEGDHQLIESILEQPWTEDEYHSIGLSVLDIVQSDERPEDTRVLMLLYEKGPCSLCRGWFVDSLDALGMVPDWMRAEAQYDANLELRAKMRGNKEESV